MGSTVTVSVLTRDSDWTYPPVLSLERSGGTAGHVAPGCALKGAAHLWVAREPEPVWTDSMGSVVIAVASSHRTSLARWPTSWKRSRSKSWSRLAAPGRGPAAWLSSRLLSSLFMWVQPEITQKLYVALWAAFLASCFFPYRLVGLALGKETRVVRRGAGRGRASASQRDVCPALRPPGRPAGNSR